MLPRLKFRHRISLLVVLAAAALLAVTTVTLVSGRENTRQLTGIETRYVPLIELDATLKRLYASIVRTLEDAAGAGEPVKIEDADRLSAEFRARVTAASNVLAENGGDAAQLVSKFDAYYRTAREVSAAVAGGAQFQQIADKIEQMRRAQADVSLALDAATTPDRAKLASAFAAARESQATSLQLDIVVACVALLLMAVLSWRTIRHMIRALRELSEGVTRLAHGEFGRAIDVPAGDELGDLAHEANRTAERLRDYREQSEREAWIKSGIAELAGRIAGEHSVDVLARGAVTHIGAYIDAVTSDILLGDESDERVADLARGGAVTVRGTGPYDVCVPLLHEEHLLGVMRFETATVPGEKCIDLLGRVAPMVAVALRVAASREREHEMLIETQRQARAAQTANKELEAFSYSVSHDLRAPLRGIDGFSQALVEDESDRLSPEGLKYLQRIRGAAQRMGELIDDLLRLSRVSRADFRRDDVDLSALAETVVGELRRAHPDRRVDVIIQPGVKAHADARLARIVLENLFGNAWKFTSKSDAPRIELAMRVDGNERVYSIRDNGAGFDMKYVNRLFGAFQRLHSDSDYPGTGIGLATVQRIVLRHGGRIWVEAAVGQGAAFYFTFPDETSPPR